MCGREKWKGNGGGVVWVFWVGRRGAEARQACGRGGQDRGQFQKRAAISSRDGGCALPKSPLLLTIVSSER